MKHISLAAACAAGLLAAVSAPAATLGVSKSARIAAPPDQVWSAISAFGDLTWVSSIVKSSHATEGNNVGSVRTLDLGGPQLTERLTAYDPRRMRYSYVIIDSPENRKVLPVSHYQSTISVRHASGGASVVTWSGKFERADPSATPAAGQGDSAAVKAVTGVYTTGLKDLQKKFGG